MSFQQFSLCEALNQAIADLGFEKPSEIQEQAIPILLDYKGDFVGQAQTGTGKTAAFLLPLLERLNIGSQKVEALILTPTRELAHQVQQELEKFSKHLPVQSMTIYGGVPYDRQIRKLKQERPQIVVGTPGRIIDLINKGALDLGLTSRLVIDEADEMLNMGFLEDVQHIISQLSKKKRLWMFSATMPAPIVKLIEEEFSKPKMVKVKKKTLTNEDIAQYFCLLQKKDFAKGLRRVFESQLNCYGIAFCETRESTKKLADDLTDMGVDAVALHGELSQSQRDWAMKRFKEKKVPLLVCTDVAARGIDVSHVTHVFNMGLPKQNESYVHRIGRTGRAGEKGTSIAFVSPSDKFRIKQIEKVTGLNMAPYKLPELNTLKEIKMKREMDRMDSIRGALLERGDGFSLDESFALFEKYFDELSKEQVLKLLFSYHYNKEIRFLEEGLQISAAQMVTKRGNRSERSRKARADRNSERGGFRSSRGGRRRRRS